MSQTATVLRERIQSGVWPRWLPGEHELCAQLQVSRVTLRAALAQLQREGLVKSSQGRRREVVARRRSWTEPAASKTVVLLTPIPLEGMPRFALYWTYDLREHLAEAGYHLDIHESRACSAARPESTLEVLAGRLRPAAWLLYQSTAPMQRWFSERALPAVITGSRHAGVSLPTVDVDYRAACRHAGGQFLARGHRHVAFLNHNSGLAGDAESEDGFLEALGPRAAAPVEAMVSRHDGSPAGICRQLDGLLDRAVPPTAFLVSKPHHLLTALGHLNRRGVDVPGGVSLISRDDESFLEHVVPTVARYSASSTAMARKVSRLVLELVRSGTLRPRDHRVMPQYVPGESLASCRAG